MKFNYLKVKDLKIKFKLIKMETNFMEKYKVKRRVVLVKFIFRMEIFTKENGKMINRMVKGNLCGQMVMYMKVNGKTTKGNIDDIRNG
jgi:hypothetical protein